MVANSPKEFFRLIEAMLFQYGWSPIIISEQNMIIKYLGAGEDLFYIYLSLYYDEDYMVFNGLLPQTLSKKDSIPMHYLCNIINPRYTIGALELDFEREQVFFRLGLNKYSTHEKNTILIDYLIYMCNALECINQIIIDMKQKALLEYEDIFNSYSRNLQKWIDLKKKLNWSFIH